MLSRRSQYLIPPYLFIHTTRVILHLVDR